MNYRIKDELDVTTEGAKPLIKEGKRLIAWAEREMSGLKALQKRADQPLRGARIAGSLHITNASAVLIKTLQILGADVRWSACNPLSTQDAIAAALAADGIPVFGWRAMNEQEYTEGLDFALSFTEGAPHLLIDDGGDLTERLFTNHPEMISSLVGISEETTTGIRRLEHRAKQGKLPCPAIDVNGAQMKSYFDNYLGSRESFIDGLRRALPVTLAGKRALVIGYGDVGRGCAESLQDAGAHASVAEISPVRSYQAHKRGFHLSTMDAEAAHCDIFVTATGCCRIIHSAHFPHLKNGAILCNMGHFDCEIAFQELTRSSDYSRDTVTPLVDRFTYRSSDRSFYVLARGRLVNLVCGEGHPPDVMSTSMTGQALAQIALWQERKKWSNGVHPMPLKLDEENARAHLAALDLPLTELTVEQKSYLT